MNMRRSHSASFRPARAPRHCACIHLLNRAMWTVLLCFALSNAWAATTVTILEGPAQVLRGTAWLKLAEGARLQEGDIVSAPERTHVQLELSGGSAFSFNGPATLYAIGLPAREGQPQSGAELAFWGAFFKLATGAKEANIRVQTPLVLIVAQNATALVGRADNNAFAIFVENGSASIAERGARGRTGTPQNAKAGQYWSAADGKSLASAERPPQAFIGAMPKPFLDPLPSRSNRFADARVDLPADHEVTYQEAKPWLVGPYRRAFVRRLQPRLRDAAFRSGVEAEINLHPEWDRILHPEKYRPKDAPPVTVTPTGRSK